MILITGAGGTVGGELVRTLSSQKVTFRAAYHTAGKVEKARGAGIDAVGVDFGRPETLQPALKSVDTMFLLSGSGPNQGQLEGSAVRAAKSAGVERIVKLSVWGAESEAFRFAKIHRSVEKEIQTAGLTWTFLRPNGFMQNYANFFAATIKTEGAFYLSGGEARVSHIDVRDIASVAAKVLTGSGHEGKAYELSGPEAITNAQIAGRLSAALGRRIAYVELSPADLKSGMLGKGTPEWYADALVDLIHYYAGGHASRVTPAVRRITGRDPIPFDQFVKDYIRAFA